jgi:hypothetical protein
MKKILLSLFLLLPLFSYSQSIGLKGGFNISNIKSNSTLLETSSLASPSFGIAIFTGLTKIIDIAIEPTYSTFGGKDAISFTDPLGTTVSKIAKVKYYYLELPVSINFFPRYRTNVIGLHAGMAPMYFLSKDEEFTLATTTINDVVFSPFAGGTFGYKFHKKAFIHLVARYYFPLSNIYKDAPYSTKFNSVNFFLILGRQF